MKSLRIPVALDEHKKLCYPKDAERGKNYFCPSCGEAAIFRKGAIKIEHFAHKASLVCNQETITHITAKLLIQKAVHDWKTNNGPRPVVIRRCEICWEDVEQPLPEKVENATIEQRLQDGSIADVALLVNGTPEAAIEIKVTHAVDMEKSSKLSVPYIELDGYEVISYPVIWKPISDGFKPFICDKCKENYKKFQIKTFKIAHELGIELPKDYYQYGLCKCWKCKREIIVYDWPNKFNENLKVQKKEHPPLPKSVQYRFSKTVGHSYWANTCPYCKSIQGRWFLHNEPEGTFFIKQNMMPNDKENEEEINDSFQKDLMKIAEHAAELEML